MTQTIKAKEQSLERIFSNDYLFVIPAYQRPYSWTTEQTSELLDDLLAAVEGDDEVDEISPYFLGSIVLINDPAETLAEVVDGQQRLTTLTILFCVLRELSQDTDAHRELDGYVHEKGKKFGKAKDRFRLSLRKRDQDFFENNVQIIGALPKFLEQEKATRTDSEQRIFENAKYLWSELEGEDQADRDRLTAFLIQKCYLVAVSASDQESAYRVFSVMNARGLDLSPTDILKADIIGAMDGKDEDKYTNHWEETEEELGRDEFRDLFTHIRMIYVKSKMRRNLNQEFRDGVLTKVNGGEFIDEVLTPYAEVYQVVSRAAYESTSDADKVNSYLRHLGELDNYDWMPPAIAFFKSKRYEQSALERFIRDLERLAYGLFILRANVNNRINRYAAVLHSIEKGGDDLFEESSLLQLKPDEKEDIISALNGPIYHQTRVRMPLLLRLDSLLADEGATYEHKVLSIEHVLPQKPAEGSEWLEWFPDLDVREEWTHKIANLVLLSRRKNTQARNFDFERKKQEYFQKAGTAPFAITSQVLNESEWTVDVLKKRQCDLIGKLKTEWRL